MPKAKPPSPATSAARNVPLRNRTVKMLKPRLVSMVLAPKVERAALAWREPHLTGRLQDPRSPINAHSDGSLKCTRGKSPRLSTIDAPEERQFPGGRNSTVTLFLIA